MTPNPMTQYTTVPKHKTHAGSDPHNTCNPSRKISVISSPDQRPCLTSHNAASTKPKQNKAPAAHRLFSPTEVHKAAFLASESNV